MLNRVVPEKAVHSGLVGINCVPISGDSTQNQCKSSLRHFSAVDEPGALAWGLASPARVTILDPDHERNVNSD
jgi:hypothetical protein